MKITIKIGDEIMNFDSLNHEIVLSFDDEERKILREQPKLMHLKNNINSDLSNDDNLKRIHINNFYRSSNVQKKFR